jgi:hypothetical protein
LHVARGTHTAQVGLTTALAPLSDFKKVRRAPAQQRSSRVGRPRAGPAERGAAIA